MYGYVRPLKGELKVSEYESFQAVYCGLCHSLKKQGGFAARFLVNYDLTFLAMLLDDGGGCVERKRCPARLWGKKRCLCGASPVDIAADQSIILAWWKFDDEIRDGAFPRRLLARLLKLLFHRAYRTACARQPDFAKAVEENLRALNALEATRCESIDATADKFALILRSVALSVPDGERRRVLGELLYHLGRCVYLLDATNDLTDDEKHERYNPLRYRFNPIDGSLSESDREQLHGIVRQSVNCVIAAYELLDKGSWNGILSNILYLGLPWVTDAVFSGQWQQLKNIKKNRTEPS